MPAPSVTYSFTNGTASDATAVNTNFTDLVNALSDGQKDITVSSVTTATLTVSGVASFNGAVNLGNATGDDITVTGYIASDLLPKTAGTASLGSSTQTWEDIYLDEGATNGGTIYFDAGTTKYIQSNAAGTILTIGGFTTVATPALTTTNLISTGTSTVNLIGSSTGYTITSNPNGGLTSLFQVNSIGGTNIGSGISVIEWGTNKSPNIVIGGSRSGSIGSFSAITSGWVMGILEFAGDDSVKISGGPSIQAVANGTWTTSDRRSSLNFYTIPNSSIAQTLAMQIDNAQSVVPQKLLDLSTSTAGQIKFPATQNASADANTLDDYREATWTPVDASGAGLSFTVADASYEKIGRVIIARFTITYPATVNTNQSAIAGLPFTNANILSCGGFVSYSDAGGAITLFISNSGTTIFPYKVTGADWKNNEFSGKIIRATVIYRV